ncbi:hypothetical protein GPJ56_010884 [Histomonas meleagridis]|uniref:uncharacterized protein n=1 Tax=Histomonas meleagridis TaxID=135588 RepID=UPI0035597EF1|nr:hypothetical protein GPJ56_010884 [Histomonas meleagridis]KAH0803694.1 hypothetical protein GO595_003468 [Histomonas meleagridis]
MPGKRARGPPTKIPIAPDPRKEIRLRSQNLEKQIQRKKDQKVVLKSSLNSAGTRLNQANEDHQQVVKDTQEVVGDITREFKVQQNDNRKQIEALQKYAAELEKKLSEIQMKIRKTKDKFELQKQQKDEIIQKNEAKSEQMVQEFREMLQTTLVKMSDRIDTSHDSEENSSGINILPNSSLET